LRDQFYLLQALAEAKKGRGFCSPNPAVGAVAVKKGKIIAKGYHHACGAAHAEVECLNQFPKGTENVTLYVSLEPCNHYGKTPPCVDAIIEHGIEKVVYGFQDPNHVVRANNSDEILNRHHIQTQYLLLPEIQSFYQSYVYWNQTKKPWVTVKWAQTLDAKNGIKGQNIHFTQQEAFEFTHQCRHQTDIILSTSKTIIHDGSHFTARMGKKMVPKPLAIIDRKSILTGHEPCFSFERPIWIFHQLEYAPQFSNDRVNFIAWDGGLAKVFSTLGQVGFHDVWVEVGAQMMALLHSQGLVNTSYVYVSAKLFGRQGTEAFQEPLIDMQKATDIQWYPMGYDVRAKINW
jgi:diaminohydroxyphosphoribosylaminopyrimidine deaminase / 5-amino-6-(5-phosphoribosylamino)uracil reductase